MKKPIDIAFSQYGIVEGIRDEDNPEVLKYFDAMGLSGKELHDSTAWCSAFVNYCCIQSGFEHSGKLNARSWLNIGEEINEPKPGDIAIFWRERPDSWKGHVGFYINHNDRQIFILGGNQQNMVCVQAYPIKRLLGFRRLKSNE